ncbi:hypothetical protein CPB85DRAFT_1320043 [Mucidula mucida]|nr:hypothetical protein CPB85DRAFT_1320043 [Mucidula mucida]
MLGEPTNSATAANPSVSASPVSFLGMILLLARARPCVELNSCNTACSPSPTHLPPSGDPLRLALCAYLFDDADGTAQADHQESGRLLERGQVRE